ncbi:MAG: PSD1 and planctomycete cytochrome C domain-containing protein [Verrucomicrobiota bacterium]|nr:PSD1 and planctomycete cytochrome C domain-containing protein [Verrucomicrobiota bacterium]
MHTRRLLVLALSGFGTLVAAQSQEEMMMMGDAARDPKKLEFFETKVRPILEGNCYKCHSLEQNKAKGGLTMDTREALLKGSDNGAVIVPGQPEKSLLIKAISYTDPDLQMPPEGEKLSAQQIADLTQWVKMGAPDPRKADKSVTAKLSGLTDNARSHWAYQPIKKPAFPAIRNRAWCITPVDTFIMQKLEEKGIAPSPDAGKETLLRRATFDLIGLPPTPQEINAFLLDHSPEAFVRVVDRLLASRHYGERWGRYWLDTARYADTIGGDRNARQTDYRYPYAWTYRDYVIRSFNEDKPYDRFILEQLAADKLPDLKSKADLAALGFLTVGERFNNNNDVINDRIDVVSKGFLGLTVVCARCHDHMFDPIPTEDYYALHGVFNSIFEPSDKPLLSEPLNDAQTKDFSAQLGALEKENRDIFYRRVGERNRMFREKAAAYLMAGYGSRRNAPVEEQQKAQQLIKDEKLEPELVRYVDRMNRGDDPVFGPWARFVRGGDSWKVIAAEIASSKKTNPIVAAAFRGFVPNTFEDVAALYGQIFARIEPRAEAFMKASTEAQTAPLAGWNSSEMALLQQPFAVELAGKLDSGKIRELSGRWPQRMRDGAGFGFVKINELLLTHPGAPPRAMVVQDKPKPGDSAVFIRGQAENRGKVVPRRFLQVLSGGKPTPFKLGSGRLELGRAIASKNNPLAARVIVNRVWMHHFGQGFVRTPDDLGTQSEAPSHPELIDYLSGYFMEQGWSLKKLHRLIMLSKVYRMSSHTVPAHEEIDPDNRLLWRANVRRLDFEALRDSLLVFSGKIDPRMGGQPVNLTDEPYSYRRTVYGYIDRGNVPELMSHFDFSDPDMPNSKRTTTVVPQQALFLMNSPMSIEVARAVLARPAVAHARENLTRIHEIYRVILQRNATSDEVRLALQFVGHEMKQEPQVAEAAKALTDNAQKQLEKKMKSARTGRNDGVKAIQNRGEYVERKPLTPWETFAQALLFSNEAAYVH